MTCMRCGAVLDGIDIGAHRKLISRAAKEFFCRDCLAKELGWDRAYLDQTVLRFRRWGCTLFPPLPPDSNENNA